MGEPDRKGRRRRVERFLSADASWSGPGAARCRWRSEGIEGDQKEGGPCRGGGASPLNTCCHFNQNVSAFLAGQRSDRD